MRRSGCTAAADSRSSGPNTRSAASSGSGSTSSSCNACSEWARRDSNPRSLRNWITASSLWPLGYGPGRTVASRPHRSATGVNRTMPSFDVVSEVDMQEVRNAVDQAARELSQRFDFKGTDSSIELKEKTIELHTESEPRLDA